MDPDQEWADWQAWLGDRIWNQVVEMMAFRQVWEVFLRRLQERPGLGPRGRHVPGVVPAGLCAIAGDGRAPDGGHETRRSVARQADHARPSAAVDPVARAVPGQPIAAGDDLRTWANATFDTIAGLGDHISTQIPAQDFDDLQTKRRRPSSGSIGRSPT